MNQGEADHHRNPLSTGDFLVRTRPHVEERRLSVGGSGDEGID
jgi:hypothetical protein